MLFFSNLWPTTRRAVHRTGVAGLILMVRLYRGTLGLLFAPSCRYTPTCSQYAIDALNRYGVIGGAGRTARRILRCHPFSKHNSFDPA